MTLARATFALPAAIARSVYRFLFVPAAQAHPARLESLLPQGLDALEGPASRELIKQLGDAEPHLRLDQVTHRIALLECDPLSALAHRVALLRSGWALRRVVRRSDRLVLDAYVSADDWQCVYSQEALLSAPPDTGTPSTERIIGELENAGWALIESASHALPSPIGNRLRLKCPMPNRMQGLAQRLPAAEECLGTLAAVYRDWCERDLPGWDSALASASSPGSTSRG